MNINTISGTILDEASSPEALREALDAFVASCGEITNIRPESPRVYRRQFYLSQATLLDSVC